jgi:NADPH:quinone reductase-like Zn-dependent oxidoreductase
MRAYLVEEPDGEFRAVELPRPTPGKGQVLVRIAASGVNPLDTKIRAGKAAHAKQPLPAVLGLDMAGSLKVPDWALFQGARDSGVQCGRKVFPVSRRVFSRERMRGHPSAFCE